MSNKDLIPVDNEPNERLEKLKKQASDFAKTTTGKRVIRGGAAGAAIGLALPGITILAGAALGAGALVLWKSFKEQD